MSSSRDEIFKVMGLGPAWTLRAPLTNTETPIEKLLEPETAVASAVSAAAFPVVDPQTVLERVTLEDLASQVAQCQQCGLCKSRRQTVFSAGVAGSSLMVVGEAPGADEDARGEPFVGRAGQLLDKMLQALELSRRSNVYIGNVLKCRPPGNRNPEPEEVASCLPYLHQQIVSAQPKVLLLAGAFAIKALLNTSEKVGQLRGQVHQVQIGERSWPAIVTYHPAYLLRNPIEKRKSWQDLLLLQQTLAPHMNQ